MIIFYICSLLPIIFGGILYAKDKEITWQEWFGGSIASILTAIIFHISAFYGMTRDIETLSGLISRVEHHPEWTERYEERHTSGSGKNERVWYTTEYQIHPEHYEAELDFGCETERKEISYSIFISGSKNFGGHIVENPDGQQSSSHGGSRSSGDRNIYCVFNKTGYVYPVTTLHHFENRIKAAPTVFSFGKVPDNIPVYEWPENPNWQVSNRLLGLIGNGLSILEWDRMNSELGPRKKINLIMIGFGQKSSEIAEYQRSKFIGGKKNDVVICYGGSNPSKADWVVCFGWTENELCKRNLETIVLTHKIDNQLIPLIKQEIYKNYEIKDWSKFDYISIEPPTWAYYVYFVVMIVSQGCLYLYFHVNQFGRYYRLFSRF